MKGKENKPHTKRIRTMALSVFLAVIVWIMVMSLTNPNITTTVSNLNVRFVGEQTLRDKKLAVTGRNSIPTLSVVVRGNRQDLMSYLDDIYVQVDVSNISEAGEYNLSGTISVPTTRISVERENYSDIPITVEPIISKDIALSIKQTGVPRGKLVESTAQTPIISLTGAQSELEKVAGAVATVDVSAIGDVKKERYGYVLTDESGSLISGNETIESTRAEVDITSTVYDAKTLPVEPALSAEMDKLYTLNTDKTVFSPSSVTVGVKPDNTDSKVLFIIDRPADENEQEYMLQRTDGMYIPHEESTVKAKPVLESKDPATPAEGAEGEVFDNGR